MGHLTKFEHICYFNLTGSLESGKKIIPFIAPELYEYKDSFHQLKNGLELPFNVNQELLDLMISCIDKLDLDLKKRQTAKFKRGQFNSNRSYWHSQLLKSNDELCKICQRADNITIDHIIPLSKGGENELNNLQFLCKSCNSSKYNKIL